MLRLRLPVGETRASTVQYDPATEQSVCCMCGKAFDGRIAACDACGAPMKVEPVTSEERHAFRSLASVPGNSKDRAKVLAVKGFDVDHVVRQLRCAILLRPQS